MRLDHLDGVGRGLLPNTVTHADSLQDCKKAWQDEDAPI